MLCIQCIHTSGMLHFRIQVCCAWLTLAVSCMNDAYMLLITNFSKQCMPRNTVRLPRAWQHAAPGWFSTAHEKLSPGACRTSCERSVSSKQCSIDQLHLQVKCSSTHWQLAMPITLPKLHSCGAFQLPGTASPRMWHTLKAHAGPRSHIGQSIAGQSIVAMRHLSRAPA